MSEGNPAEEGNAGPATSLAETEAAACVGAGHTGDRSGLDEEIDEYDELLAALGRTEEEDQRIAVHEAGHAICARRLGHEVGGMTVNPDPVRGSEGLCWGVGHTEAFTEGRGDASNVREVLAPLMPEPGKDASSVSDVFANVYGHCIELMAGQAAERMLLGDDDTLSAGDDHRQARELAMLICSSEASIETFISHCEVAACDLLSPYGAVIMTLQLVLRIKRTLDGAEIDKIISDMEAHKALAMEHQRRAEWRKSELVASRFRAKCDYLDSAVAASSLGQVP